MKVFILETIFVLIFGMSYFTYANEITSEIDIIKGQVLYYSFTSEEQSNILVNGSNPFGAEIYQHKDFAGWVGTITGDIPDLGAMRNEASSARAYMGCTLMLYDHNSYVGKAYPVIGDDRHFIGLHDEASSAKLVNCPIQTGSVLDMSGNNNHGAIYGINGTNNNEYSISHGSFIDIPGNNGLNPSYLTLNTWVNSASDGILIGRTSNGSDHQYNLSIEHRKPIIYIKKNGGWYSVTTNEIIPSNEWSLITGTWDGNSLNIYINGVLKGINQNIPAGELDKFNSGSTSIGMWWYKYPVYFTGEIDDVRIYNRSLSALEIRKIYDLGIGNKPPVAIFSVSPQQGQPPLTVTLDASSSSDPDGTIEKYDWSVNGQPTSPNNGVTNSNIKEMTFNTAGTYTIELTVTDNDGLTDKAQKTVKVNEIRAPDIRIDPTTLKFSQ